MGGDQDIQGLRDGVRTQGAEVERTGYRSTVLSGSSEEGIYRIYRIQGSPIYPIYPYIPYTSYTSYAGTGMVSGSREGMQRAHERIYTHSMDTGMQLHP